MTNITSLQNAKQIDWITSRDILNGSEGYQCDIPLKSLRLGDDWYIEKYQILSQAPINSAIIDIGCNQGSWFGNVRAFLPNKTISIGIDPIDYNVQSAYDHYYQCAIDNVEQESLTFNLFDEPGCNSLLPKSEHLSMRNVLSTITVPVKTLESVLLEHFNNETIIHYVKCDCQGKDVDVIKSLRSFLPLTQYVQIETSFDKTRPFYVNQPSFEEDIASMNELGFEPIYWMVYPDSPLPEGEILFKNKKK